MKADDLPESKLVEMLESLNETPKSEEPATEPQLTTIQPLPEFNENFVAYGISYNDALHKYFLFSIDYNPITGYTGNMKSEAWADSAPTALNKLNKIMSLKLLKKEEKF